MFSKYLKKKELSYLLAAAKSERIMIAVILPNEREEQASGVVKEHWS